MNQRLRFLFLYLLTGFFLFPVLRYVTDPGSMKIAFWQNVIRWSGPALIYLGLVLQRTGKPVPIARRMIGILTFLIGFGWLFSLLMAISG